MATITLRRALPWAGAAATAAGLGALAFVNDRKARRAVAEHPPRGTFTEVDGVRLHYLEKGAGPPLLLIHGNGVMIDDWIISGLFDELASTHRVIAVDRPGFGHSDRPRGTAWTPERQAALFAGLLDRLDAAPALVVGHSYGALAAAAMALEHPGHVRAVALLGGLFFPDPRADVMLVSGNAMPGWGDLLNRTVAPPLARALEYRIERKIFGPAEVPAAWRAGFPWELALRPSRIRAGAADAVHIIPAARRLAPRWGELAMPVAILAGAGDRLVDPSHSRRLHEALPRSRMIILDGVGHMVHHTQMHDVAAAVRLL